MYKITFILSLCLSSLFAQSTQPNILYIMSDDHSAAAIGAYATTLKGYVDTPNMDRLAKEGALFTNVHCTNSLCAPSRSAILTGLYGHKNGVVTLREDLNTKNTATVPGQLKKAGYTTAIIGKWHIHGDNMYGFDHYEITTSQGSYFNPGLGTAEGKNSYQGYSSDVYTDVSINWLKQRDKTKPFMLMTHYKAAHGPWEFAPRHKELFKDVTIPEPPTLFDDYATRDPNGVPKKQSRIHNKGSKMSLSFWFENGKKGQSGEWPTGTEKFTGSDIEIAKQTYQKYIKDYLRCVKGIDEGIGRLLDYLEAEGELDNTIIIYTSDQGMYIGEHGFFDKRLGLKPAVKMPLIIRYPKTIEAGTKINEMVNNVDFAESLIDMGNGEIPSSMQGFSFWDLVQGKEENWPRKQTIYTFYSSGTPKHYGLITKDYKILKYLDKTGNPIGMDLFDRHADPNETNNLAKNPEYKSIISQLEASLKEEMLAIDMTNDHLPGKFKPAHEKEPKVKKTKKAKKDKQTALN